MRGNISSRGVEIGVEESAVNGKVAVFVFGLLQVIRGVARKNLDNTHKIRGLHDESDAPCSICEAKLAIEMKEAMAAWVFGFEFQPVQNELSDAWHAVCFQPFGLFGCQR